MAIKIQGKKIKEGIMQHTLETPSSVERKLILSFEGEEVNKYIDSAVKELSRNVTLDGFRKGKVPAKVIEGKFPEDVQSRASEALVNTNIQKVLTENNIIPVSRVNFVEIEGNTDTQIKRNAAYKFAVSFDVLPEFELPKLEELSIDEEQVVVTEAEIEAFSRRLRQTSATLNPVEEAREPKDFDICTVDIEGSFEGAAVPGMKGENIQVQLKPDADELSKEIENIMRSMKAGEEKTGKIKLPETYPDPNFRNTEIDMKVTLVSISEEVLPELNEELIKKFGFEDMEKFNEFVTENIANQSKQKIKTETQNKLLDQILEGYDYELPKSFVTAHKNEYMMEARKFVMQQGQDPKEAMEALKRMEEDSDVEARKQAKAQVFLMAVALSEKVVISDQELQNYIMRAAQETGQDPKEVMERLYQTGGFNEVSERLQAAKALEIVYSKATKNPVDKDGKPVAVKEEKAAEKDPA